MWKKILTAEHLAGVSVSVFCLILYLKTLCPTTDFIDSGELTTVAYTLGIAHPTGYPLFTLIGWIFSHLPFFASVVYRMNVMAAVLCAIGLFTFFKFLYFFTVEFLRMKISRERFLPLIPSILGTLALGLSGTFWSQATAVEVYSLHTVFLSVLLLIFMKAIWKAQSNPGSPVEVSTWLWQGFAFILGLSFTNHMTTILLAPGFLFLYFYTYKFGKRSWLHLLRLVPSFLLGLSLYCYLPIRAGSHPLLAWGNPVEFERFWWHFTGKQYRVWIFSSSESAMKQLNYFLTTVSAKFAYVPIPLALIGLWDLARHHRVLLLFTLFLFFGCLLYAINYDIHDIDSYFLLAFYTIALWSAVGYSCLSGFLNDGRQKIFVGIGSIVLLTAMMVMNYREADESSSYLVEDYTRDMLNSVEKDAIVISYQWDYFVSAAYYFQIVEQVRPDVIIIDKELLRRSWYYRQMQTRYPWLYAGSQNAITAFLNELYKFEHDLPYDPGGIERKYQAVIRSFIETNYSTRPIYATPEIEESYISGYTKVPSGLAFRLYKDSGYHSMNEPKFSYRLPAKSDQYTDGLMGQYARAYVNNSIYMHLGRKDDIALQLLNKALEINPGMPEALSLKESIMKKG